MAALLNLIFSRLIILWRYQFIKAPCRRYLEAMSHNKTKKGCVFGLGDALVSRVILKLHGERNLQLFHTQLSGATILKRLNAQEVTMSKVMAKVISRKGPCKTHKVGDEFVIGERTPANVCPWAFNSLFPFAQVLLYDGSFPWAQDPDKATIACPDPDNAVVFELRRT